MVPVDANFLEDVRVQLLDFIDAGGIEVPASSARTPSDVAGLYFALKRRLLTTAPRPALRSRELLTQTLAPAHEAIVAEIERRSVAGESLRSFLSRGIVRDPERHDAMLNDWGFYHFHLGGRIPEADGFVQRSRELLFAFATNDRLLLAAVGDHHSFEDDALLQIVHDNWPDAIAQDRAGGWSADPDESFTPAMRRTLRRRGLTTFTQVKDGTLYLPPGGGYMKSGLSTRARIASDRLLERAHALEVDFRARADALARTIRERTGRMLLELHLNLQLGDGGGMSVIETQTRFMFPVAA